MRNIYPKAAAALVAEAWSADTRRKIEMKGQWPADLPKWPTDQNTLND